MEHLSSLAKQDQKVRAMIRAGADPFPNCSLRDHTADDDLDAQLDMQNVAIYIAVCVMHSVRTPVTDPNPPHVKSVAE